MSSGDNVRTLWTLDTARRDRPYRRTRPQTREWLAANGIDEDQIAYGTKIRILAAGPDILLSTWQVDTDRRRCPHCQSCPRGHVVLTVLTAALPQEVAVAGCRAPHIDPGWLTDVNDRATTQATATVPAPAEAEADA